MNRLATSGCCGHAGLSGALVLIVVFGTAGAMLQQGTFAPPAAWRPLPRGGGEGASAPVEGNPCRPTEQPGDSASGRLRTTGRDRVASGRGEPAGLSERLRAGALERILGPEEERVGTGWRMPALYRVGAIVVLMALLASLTHYGMGVLAGLVGLRLVVSLRMQLAEHLMGLSMRYHTGRRFGDLLSRISDGRHAGRPTHPEGPGAGAADVRREHRDRRLHQLETTLFASWGSCSSWCRSDPGAQGPQGQPLQRDEAGIDLQVPTQMFRMCARCAYRAEDGSGALRGDQPLLPRATMK